VYELAHLCPEVIKVLDLALMNSQMRTQEMMILAGPAQQFTDQDFLHCLGLSINWEQFGNL